jgi:hypothetical protein
LESERSNSIQQKQCFIEEINDAQEVNRVMLIDLENVNKKLKDCKILHDIEIIKTRDLQNNLRIQLNEIKVLEIENERVNQALKGTKNLEAEKSQNDEWKLKLEKSER